jgi:multidrug transporter EmrE-like cation transporter
MVYILLAANVSLMSIGQLLFKQSAIFVNQNSNLNILTRYLFNPWFYGAVAFFAVATFIWVQILTTMKISVAYPLLSVSYIITAAGAFYFFGEKLSPVNLVGIFLIMLGVSLVSVK